MRLKQVDLMKTTSVITRSGETLRYVSHFEQFKKLAWHNSDLKHSHAASCSSSEKYQSCVVVEVINLKLTTYFSDYFSRRFACQIVCMTGLSLKLHAANGVGILLFASFNLQRVIREPTSFRNPGSYTTFLTNRCSKIFRHQRKISTSVGKMFFSIVKQSGDSLRTED